MNVSVPMVETTVRNSEEEGVTMSSWRVRVSVMFEKQIMKRKEAVESCFSSSTSIMKQQTTCTRQVDLLIFLF